MQVPNKRCEDIACEMRALYESYMSSYYLHFIFVLSIHTIKASNRFLSSVK